MLVIQTCIHWENNTSVISLIQLKCFLCQVLFLSGDLSLYILPSPCHSGFVSGRKKDIAFSLVTAQKPSSEGPIQKDPPLRPSISAC